MTMNTNKGSIAQDIQSFKELLQWVFGYCNLQPKAQEDVLNDNLECFEYMLQNEMSPDDFFDFLARGSFKECYIPRSTTQFVIKFVTEDNRTEDELDALNLSYKANVGDFFLPTKAFKLNSCTLPANLITDSDDRYEEYSTLRSNGEVTYHYRTNPDFEAYRMDYVIIQPTVTPLENRTYTKLIPASVLIAANTRHEADAVKKIFVNEYYPTNPLIVNSHPFLDGNLVFKMADLCRYREWWEAALNHYGAQKCADFIAFCDEHNIHDLHEGNVGFVKRDGKEYPILLDWLSD